MRRFKMMSVSLRSAKYEEILHINGAPSKSSFPGVLARAPQAGTFASRIKSYISEHLAVRIVVSLDTPRSTLVFLANRYASEPFEELNLLGCVPRRPVEIYNGMDGRFVFFSVLCETE